MKKLLLAVATLVLYSATAVAQEKGETQFSLGGSLFESEKLKASGADAVTTISPSVGVRYLITDKVGIDGDLTFISITDQDAAIFIGAGGRYYYYSQEKMRLNGGINARIGLGDGAKRLDDKGDEQSPIDLTITLAELEYWPMEGGAITAAGFFGLNGLNLGDFGSTAFGVNLGIKIRIK
jgi:hypothetical protein